MLHLLRLLVHLYLIAFSLADDDVYVSSVPANKDMLNMACKQNYEPIYVVDEESLQESRDAIDAFKYSVYFWNGYECEGWSSKTMKFYDGEEMNPDDFPLWAKDNECSRGTCGWFIPNGNYKEVGDSSCNNKDYKGQAICQKDADGDCNNDEEFWKYGDVCLRLEPNIMKQVEIKDTCNKYDAIIMPVKTEEQRNDMFQEIKYGYFSKTWTGVKKEDGEWKNPDGSNVPDGVWGPNEPSGDGDCGYISSRVEFKMVAKKCSDVVGLVICEREDRERRVPTTTTTVETTATTEEATTTTTNPTTTTEEPTTTTTVATTTTISTTTEVPTTTMETTTEVSTTTMETTTEVSTTTVETTMVETTEVPTTTTTDEPTTMMETTTIPTTEVTTTEVPTTTTMTTTTTPTTTDVTTTDIQTTTVMTTTKPTTTEMPTTTMMTTTTTTETTTKTTTEATTSSSPPATTTTTELPTTTTTPATTTTSEPTTTTTPTTTTSTTTLAPTTLTTTTSVPTTTPTTSAPTTTTTLAPTTTTTTSAPTTTTTTLATTTTTTSTTLAPTTTTTLASTTTDEPTTTSAPTTTTLVPTTTTTTTAAATTTTPPATTTSTTTTTPVPTTTTTSLPTTTEGPTTSTVTTTSTTVAATTTEAPTTIPTTTSTTTDATTTTTLKTTTTTTESTTATTTTTEPSTSTTPTTTEMTSDETTTTTSVETTSSITTTSVPTTTSSTTVETTTTTPMTTTPSTTSTLPTTSTTSTTITTTMPTTSTSTTTTTEEPTTIPETTEQTTTTTTEPTTEELTTTVEPTTEESTTTEPTTSSSTAADTTTSSTTTEATTKSTTTEATTSEEPTTSSPTSTTESTTLEPGNSSCSSYSKTSDYYWPNMKFNGTAVSDETPEFTNGPLGFGWGVSMEGNEKDGKKCLKFLSFGKDEEDEKCWNNPSDCNDGISFSIWEKISFPKKNNKPRYILSTGGDEKGTPGMALYYKGIYIYALVSTGDSTWLLEAPGPVSNDTWSNIGIKWDKKTGLEMDVNAERVAFVQYPGSTTPKPPLQPFELTIGCRRTESGQYVDYSAGSFDEIASWMRKLPEDSSECFLGGYDGKNTCDPETHPLRCETNLINIIAILEDLRLDDPKVFKDVIEHLEKIASTKPEPKELEGKTEKPSGNDTTEHPPVRTEPKDSEEEKKKCQDMENFVQIINIVLDKTSDDLRAKQNKSIDELESMLTLQVVLSHLMTEDLAGSCNPTKLEELCTLAKETEKWSLKQMQTTSFTDSSTCIRKNTDTMICESMTIMSGHMKREFESSFPFPGNCGKTPEEEDPPPQLTIPVDICGNIPAGVRLYFQMCRYLTLHKICPTTNSATGKDDTLMKIDSNPISILVHPPYSPSALEESHIVFLAEHKDKRAATGRKLLAVEDAEKEKEIRQRYCMRWKDSQTIKGSKEKGGWSDEDCKMVNSSAESTTCSCEAPGTYAVIARLRKPFDIPPEPEWLKILKWALDGISFVLLIFYVLSIAYSLPLHEQFHTVRLNLASAAIGALASFVLSDFMRDDEEVCRILSFTNHFFYTAVSSWFLMEANALFSAMVSGIVSGRVFMYLLLGWGLPGIAVGVSYVLYPDYGYDYRCMVGPNNEMRIVLIGSILLPTTVAFLWSLLTMCNIGTPVIKKTAVVNEISSAAKAHFVVNTLFLVTWVCAVFTYVDLRLDELPSFNPIFQVMNSSLGIFIVIIEGFGSRHFRSSMCRRRKDGISVKKGLDPFEYNDNAVVDKYRKTFSA